VTLDDFQASFMDALWRDGDDFAPARSPAFAVYRNTVMNGCIDTLEANYPAVACLTGRDWFRAAAAHYVQAFPPTDARMVLYGSDFAAFLESFEAAADLVYLADVARVDRGWTESFVAPDATPLDATALRLMSPDALAATVLRVHPATRVVVSPYPVASIWQASRAGEPVEADLAWIPEAVLLTRFDNSVTGTSVDTAAAPFLEACARGATLEDAASQAAERFPDTRLDLLFADLLQAGAFAA
jgi:hypothetical protein